MKRSWKIALLVAAGFVVLGVVLMLAAMVLGVNPERLEEQVEHYIETDVIGVTTVGGYDSWENYESSNIYEVETRNIHSLQIDWTAGRVEITPWEEDYIQIAEVADRDIAQADALRWRVDDNGNLRIRYFEKEKGIGINRPAKSLQVLVPEELANNWQSIQVNTASANVHIRDMAAVKLVVDTASGDVNMADVTVESAAALTTSGTVNFSGSYQQLKAHSTSGNITVENRGEGRVTEIDTTSGRVELSGEVGGLSVETISGDVTAAVSAWGVSVDAISATVRLELLDCPRELDVETTSGDVKLTLPADSGFRLEFDRTSGDLENSDFPLSRRGDEFIAGDGSAEFSVETTSGDLWIYSY